MPIDQAEKSRTGIMIEVNPNNKAQIRNLARLRTLITSPNPSIKPPLAAVESIETSRGIDGVRGIVKSLAPSIKPPLAALGSFGMAGVLPEPASTWELKERSEPSTGPLRTRPPRGCEWSSLAESELFGEVDVEQGSRSS
jgi:hypothetical protein